MSFEHEAVEEKRDKKKEILERGEVYIGRERFSFAINECLALCPIGKVQADCPSFFSPPL